MPTASDDIDDIEDLIAPGDLKPSDRYFNKKEVNVRGKKSKITNGNSEKAQNGNGECESVSEAAAKTRLIVFTHCSHCLLDHTRHADHLLENLGMFAQQQRL